jgi:ABC-type nitrate/sulfonate/bicarbonate transport system permease component
MRPSDRQRTLVTWVPLVILLLVWEATGRLWAAPLLFPWPSHILLVSVPSLALFGGAPEPDWSGALATVAVQLAVTTWRIVVGLSLGTVAGFAIGIATYGLGRRCLNGSVLLILLRSVPLFGLIPLFVLWFSGRESGVWAYIAFSTAVIVATGVQQAMANVPSAWLLQARLLGAGPMQRLGTVMLPAILPELKGTARNALGLAWAFSLGAEYAGAGDGLGYLVYLSYTYADMGKLAVLALVYCVSGLAVFWVWKGWSDRIAAWSQPCALEA